MRYIDVTSGNDVRFGLIDFEESTFGNRTKHAPLFGQYSIEKGRPSLSRNGYETWASLDVRNRTPLNYNDCKKAIEFNYQGDDMLRTNWGDRKNSGKEPMLGFTKIGKLFIQRLNRLFGKTTFSRVLEN